jgi:P27 family predicted phage terminase small subunit
MPTPVKTLDNMSKHMTRAERDARASAEDDTLPHRKIKRPAMLKDDKSACKHWARILKDMEGVEILDALDADMLGVYCAKLARRDGLQQIYLDNRRVYDEGGDRLALKTMLSTEEDLRAIERDLLAYAGKLGLTPESRNRLARRMAEQDEDDPDGDLFA